MDTFDLLDNLCNLTKYPFPELFSYFFDGEPLDKPAYL